MGKRLTCVFLSERYLKRTAQTNVEIVKEITTFAAHEFSHQWFGNLVTPEWWDYLWLSEAFATYFQYYVASLVSWIRASEREKEKLNFFGVSERLNRLGISWMSF